jgi:cytidine deaminase
MLTDEIRHDLVQRAIQARQWAYAPYSNYQVGAALLADSGRIYSGVNVENAAYPNGICAERAAVFNAVGEGERSFQAIAVVTSNGGSPCGACRQVLSEFGLDLQVIIANESGEITLETDVAGLLPGAFRPDHLVSG